MGVSKINFLRLFLLAMLINIMAQALHETGHMLVYQAYQRNPVWGFIGLVQRWDAPPLNPSHWVKTSASDGETGWLRLGTLPTGNIEQGLAAAAGPVASLLAAIFGLWLAYRHNKPTLKYIGLMLALVISFSMLLYYLRSPFRSMGDEYDIAVQFGIAKWVLEVLFALAFVFCFGLGLRLLSTWQVKLNWLVATFAGSIVTGILLMIADGWVREWVNAENLFFQPILGYSLPVLLVYWLASVGIFVWALAAKKALVYL